MSLGKGKVDVGIPWDEARSTGRGEDELSIPDGTTSSPPSCGLSTLRDRCHHGAGYVPQGVGLGVSRQMLHMPDSQLTPPTHAPRMMLLGCFPQIFTHCSQAGLLSHTWLAEGGYKGPSHHLCPPRWGETHQNCSGEEKHQAPSSPGHPH